MTKKKAKEWECKQHFSKGLAYRFSTLLVAAGCYLIKIRDNKLKLPL
jgi:hypothetical protein